MSSAPSFQLNATGVGPTFKPNVQRSRPGAITPSCASAKVVPTVGCPAIGISRAGVKMRMRMSVPAISAGSRNVLSAKFISLVRRCISAVLEPAAVDEHGELVALERPRGEDVVVQVAQAWHGRPVAS